MKFNNRALPYPLLDVTDPSRTDYNDGDYQVVIEDQQPDENGIIKIEVIHQCSIEEIIKLIETEKASFCILLICASTLVRKAYNCFTDKQAIEIRLDDFCGKVEFVPQIVVMERVEDFSSQDLNEEYDGISFDLYPGDVLATADIENRYFEFESLKFETLISLRTDPQLDAMAYSIVLDESRVYIDMGEKLRELWAELRPSTELRPLMVMSVYKDCFMIAIEELARDPDSINKRWASSLMIKIDELGYLINNESTINDLNLIAQKLLESDSVKRLIKSHLKGK